jgi:hypothetical protein
MQAGSVGQLVLREAETLAKLSYSAGTDKIQIASAHAAEYVGVPSATRQTRHSTSHLVNSGRAAIPIKHTVIQRRIEATDRLIEQLKMTDRTLAQKDPRNARGRRMTEHIFGRLAPTARQ